MSNGNITFEEDTVRLTQEQILQDAGNINHGQAMKKATEKYRKYKVRTLSPME